MKLLNRIKIEVLIILAIMFVMSFVPDMFKDVFFYEVQDCKYMYCVDSHHYHWTSQHHVWTWGAVVLLVIQVISIFIRIEKSYNQ
jgi:hypothetical protein